MNIDPKELPHQEAYKLLVGSVLPRPIAWVSSLDKNGVVNLAPFSFFMGVCSKPLTVAFAPMVKPSGVTKDTLRNCRDTKEFVVNVVPEKLAQIMNQTSFDYPAGVSEFKEVGLTEGKSIVVKPPRVMESPIQLECVVHTIVDMGDEPGAGSIVVGRVVRFHCDDKLIHDNKIDLKELKLIGRLSGHSYVRTVNDIFEIPRPTTKK